MARNPGAKPPLAVFGALLDHHLRAGTRPDPNNREPWTNTAFARTQPGRGATTGVSERSVANWRKGARLPQEIEPILRALFGPLREHGGEERLELRAAYNRAQLREAEQIIQAEPPAKDAVVWVEDGERLTIASGTPTDALAAADPTVVRRHRNIQERLEDLLEAVGTRLDNQQAWRNLARSAQRAMAAVKVPTAELPTVLVDIYDNTVSLGGFVSMDDAIGGDPSASDAPLDHDIRRALVDYLAAAAPWLRSFPSAVEWDSARHDFLTRPELFEPVRAKLPAARRFIEVAAIEGALSKEDAARASLPLETAELGGLQGEKAGYRGVANAFGLLTKATALVAAFLSGAVSSDYATRSALVQRLGGLLAKTEHEAGQLLRDASADLKAAISHVLSSNRAKQDNSDEQFDVDIPYIDKSRKRPDINMEEVKALILAGQAPPIEWVPFITELEFKDENLHDLAPLIGLSSLQDLDLMNTEVRDIVPLASLTNLEYLDLSDTQVHNLVPLAGLTNLEYLDLSNTPVSDLIPLAGLTNLKYLDLANTPVSDVVPLAGLTNLEYLDLINTPVSDLIPLAGLRSLKDLGLANTDVSDFKVLARLINLQGLNLNNTQISDLTPLAGLENLRILNISNTQVSDFKLLAKFKCLINLGLTNTRFDDLTLLAGSTNLGYLDLDNTQVSDLKPLASLSSLRKLSLTNTQVGDFKILARFSDIQDLNLSNTQFSDLSLLRGLSSLKELNLSNNQISDLSPLANLIFLHKITLHNTQISDLNFINGLNELEDIDLSNTQISDVAALAGLINLRYINLSNTQISNIAPLAGLINLRYIDISNTQVRDVAPLNALANLFIERHGLILRNPPNT